MFSVLSALTALMAAAAPTAAWISAGNLNGVILERRPVAGSRYAELRATTEQAGSLAGLCDAVFGKTKSPDEARRFKVRELIRETPTDRWTYERIAVPIVADRDYVMHVRLLAPASTGRCEVAFQTENLRAFPPRDGVTRIPLIRGSWLLTPEASGKVRVTYEVYSDPGGGIPAFLVTGAQEKAAVDFLRAILARAGK